MNARTGTLRPIAPGEILLEEFMQPLGLSQSWLSRDLDILQSRLSAIIRDERAITADTAFWLAEYFGTSARFWLNLQAEYDLRRLEREEGERTRIRPFTTRLRTHKRRGCQRHFRETSLAFHPQGIAEAISKGEKPAR